jgi:hypothetical protein
MDKDDCLRTQLKEKEIFHSYIAQFLQHLLIENASLSWCDILEHVVSIGISVIEG